MEAQSPEYRTLIYQTQNLQLAVKNHIIPLGAALVSSTLITADQYKIIRNSHNSTESRAADLIDMIQLKVKQDPQYYHIFIRVLGCNPDQYRPILQLLHKTFVDEQQLTDTTVNRGQSSVPPPSQRSGMCNVMFQALKVWARLHGMIIGAQSGILCLIAPCWLREKKESIVGFTKL